jgi:hypothetical protein
MRETALFARREEEKEILRCLWESLREPAFASTVVHLVSGKSEECEIADRFEHEASAENGEER